MTGYELAIGMVVALLIAFVWVMVAGKRQAELDAEQIERDLAPLFKTSDTFKEVEHEKELDKE